MSVYGRPRSSRLDFVPLKLLNFDLNADPDPAFHSNGDPNPDPASKNNADPNGSGSTTMIKGLQDASFAINIGRTMKV